MRVDDENDEVYESILVFDTSGYVESIESYNGDSETTPMYYSVGKNIMEFTADIEGEDRYLVDIKESRLIFYEDEYGDEDHAKIYQRVEMVPLIWILRIVSILVIAAAIIILVAFKFKTEKTKATATSPEPKPAPPPVEIPSAPVTADIGFSDNIQNSLAQNVNSQSEDVIYESDSVFIPPVPYVPADDYTPGALADDN